jgi:predicted nucleic acid-binding protein
LRRHLTRGQLLATSRIALVEVPRATAVANPTEEVQRATEQLLVSLMLVDVSERLLRAAAGIASASIRTLDSIHLASALRVEADELVAYDRRLTAAGAEQGLDVASPGVAVG